jgi:16S rRNA processing protein RimM
MVLVGAITGAHGVKGEVKVKSFTALPTSIAAYGPLFDESGERRFDLKLTSKAGDAAKGLLIGRIDGIADRNAAEALKGQQLFVARGQLPAEADPEEFYLTDLIGLVASDTGGGEIGRVSDVVNYGAGEVLVIDGGARGVFDVPFAKVFVPAVDLAGRSLTLDLPADFFETPERPIDEADAGDAADGDDEADGR